MARSTDPKSLAFGDAVMALWRMRDPANLHQPGRTIPRKDLDVESWLAAEPEDQAQQAWPTTPTSEEERLAVSRMKIYALAAGISEEEAAQAIAETELEYRRTLDKALRVWHRHHLAVAANQLDKELQREFNQQLNGVYAFAAQLGQDHQRMEELLLSLHQSRCFYCSPC